jgi:hypothetical protein
MRVALNLLSLVMLVAAASTAAAAQRAETYISPDKSLSAVVIPVGPAGRAADESLVEIRGARHTLLLKKSFASEDGEHGYVVAKAAWTPDSQFFVFSVESSGGHQPWHAPTFVYRRGDAGLLALDDFVGPVSSPDFELKAPHAISTEKWAVAERAGGHITIDLGELSATKLRRKGARDSGNSR